MSTSAYCIASVSQTELIVSELKAAGFSPDDISVLIADKSGSRDLAVECHSKASEGAATGAGTGALLGGTLGWFAGIGALAIPGLGPFIAAGPIMGALSGAAVGGTFGGLTGVLIGMGMPEFEAKRFEGKVKTGNCLISVHSEDRTETTRATQIFQQAGAHDIAIGTEASVANFSNS